MLIVRRGEFTSPVPIPSYHKLNEKILSDDVHVSSPSSWGVLFFFTKYIYRMYTLYVLTTEQGGGNPNF